MKISKLSEEIGRLLWRSRGLIVDATTRRIDASGDSFLMFQVLGLLTRHGKHTQREIAEALGQHPAGISRLIDDLEGSRLVTRKRSRVDRRCFTIEVTRAGGTKFRALLPTVVDAVDEAIHPLTRSERQTLWSLLEKVVHSSTGGGSRHVSSKEY